MDIAAIRGMEFIYFLDRNAWNVNDPEALIVEMEIIEEDDKVIAYAEQGHVTLQIDMLDERMKEVTNGERKYLFPTRKEAQAHYNEELNKEIRTLQNKSREDLLRDFFDGWNGKHIYDTKMIDAMREKIKNEFHVYV